MRHLGRLAVFGEPRRVMVIILRGSMLRMSHLRMATTPLILSSSCAEAIIPHRSEMFQS
jgi:hypothetical protein